MEFYISKRLDTAQPTQLDAGEANLKSRAINELGNAGSFLGGGGI